MKRSSSLRAPLLDRCDSGGADVIKFLFDTSRDILLIIDIMTLNQSGSILDANDAACKKLGFSRSELLELSPSAIINGEALSFLKQAKKSLTLQQPVTRQGALLTRNAGMIAAEFQLRPLPCDDRQGILVMARESAAPKTKAGNAENEGWLRLVTENMLDIIILLNNSGRIEYISPSCRNTIGYQPGLLAGTSLLEYVYPDDRAALLAAFNQAAAIKAPITAEYRLRCGNNRFLWLESRIRPCRENQASGFIITVRDISNRKKIEDQLKIQAVQDPVTGLFNRSHFEQEMSRFSAARFQPVGLIVCDLDGLKYINDTLGHEAGDQLLKTTATMLQNCFSDDETLARIGGDEFAVILPKAGEAAVARGCRRIRAAIDRYNSRSPKIPLCVSVGHAVTGPSLSFAGLFKEADNSMYRQKLHSHSSSRSSVVQALKKALEVRDFVTEGHSGRLRELSVQLAKSCGLPDYKLTDIRLFAEFHDIGKVGIPDQILFKPGPLTPDEFSIMRSHTEIGHRIAVSTPDLEPIADWILKHHEWWNGSGYPLGIAGEAIPLECRILSIADAYDAMTNDRPYRKALSHESALAELNRCAGLQFDPELVRQFISIIQSPPENHPN